jgi:hypothetical protein
MVRTVKMGETGRKNHVSPEGHAAMSAVGSRNMAAWNRSEMHRIIACANRDATERAEALIEKTIAELGGAEKLNARQASLIESQRTALLVLCLAQARLKRKGMLTRGNRPDPLLATIVSYANLVRLNLEALGIKDADRNTAPTIADIQAEYAEKHRREAAAEESDGDHAS